MNRRDLLVGGAVGLAVGGAAGFLATGNKEQQTAQKELSTPAINQDRIEMAIVATWGRDFPGLGTGAQRYA